MFGKNNIKDKVFDEPQVFEFKYKLVIKIEYCNYKYTDYQEINKKCIIKSYSYDECIKKIEKEIIKFLKSDENEYLTSCCGFDFEVLEFKIDNSLSNCLDFDLTLESKDLDKRK